MSLVIVFGLLEGTHTYIVIVYSVVPETLKTKAGLNDSKLVTTARNQVNLPVNQDSFESKNGLQSNMFDKARRFHSVVVEVHCSLLCPARTVSAGLCRSFAVLKTQRVGTSGGGRVSLEFLPRGECIAGLWTGGGSRPSENTPEQPFGGLLLVSVVQVS